ncbi:MAG: MBL fold metallo-hydrolase RNA specificity domain-containing protein [archaeon]
MAYLIDNVRKFLPHLPDIFDDGNNVKVYFKKKKSGNYDEKDYYKWERPYLDQLVGSEEISGNQGKYVLYLTFYQFAQLIDIRPEPGSDFIRSLSEPFSEEDLEEPILHRWIEHFKLKFTQAHASGHIAAKELEEAIGKISPKKLIPIHTEHPEMFNKFHPDVLSVKFGTKYDLSP